MSSPQLDSGKEALMSKTPDLLARPQIKDHLRREAGSQGCGEALPGCGETQDLLAGAVRVFIIVQQRLKLTSANGSATP